jgi:hypothetical protein
MEKPSKLQFYFWNSIGFIVRKKAIIIGTLVTFLIAAVLYTIYITPKGFYDKPIEVKPVKPVKGLKQG